MLLLFLLCMGCATETALQTPSGIKYKHIVRKKPRPLQIHVLRIDLRRRNLVLAVDVGDDPDGDGPAETILMMPSAHAKRSELLAGVNANAWRMVPPPPKGESPMYIAGRACNIGGWAVVEGRECSPVRKNYWSFWVDENGQAKLGNIAKPRPGTRWAVAGFGGLIRDGEILPGPSDKRHPRTALGIDRKGETLILAVVDGRQEGYSEGMSTRELAELMAELNCQDAMNLDGGGSSVMIRRDVDGDAKIINSPSGKYGPRPIPVMLGVCLRGKSR